MGKKNCKKGSFDLHYLTRHKVWLLNLKEEELQADDVVASCSSFNLFGTYSVKAFCLGKPTNRQTAINPWIYP